MSYEPVHIEIEPDCINIISYPGIDRSVPMGEVIKGERFRTRMYRNRRLGEFLKELHLTEGRSTGVPTIQESLAENGSPRANFKTDEDRRAVQVEIPIHPDFLEGKNNGQEPEAFEVEEGSLREALTERLSPSALKRLDVIIGYLEHNDGITPQTAKKLTKKSEATVRRYMKELVEAGVLHQIGSARSIIYEKIDIEE